MIQDPKQNYASGRLFLIPTPISDTPLDEVLPAQVLAQVQNLDYFLSERPKTSRAFLKQLPMKLAMQALRIEPIDADTPRSRLKELLEPVRAGRDAGVLSEAGCPAVADPGAAVVAIAHELEIPVHPLVGPSSLLLGLMASGLEGQRFCFHGYLPSDASARRHAVVELESQSHRLRQTQLFIETPYRNHALLDTLINELKPDTRLCIARAITGREQDIRTYPISQWRNLPRLDLAKQPTLFLMLASTAR